MFSYRRTVISTGRVRGGGVESRPQTYFWYIQRPGNASGGLFTNVVLYPQRDVIDIRLSKQFVKMHNYMQNNYYNAKS